MNNQGKAAEQLAAVFLQRAGLRIILTNYRCRFGEIDIIAGDGPVTVFVEVRRRRSARFGGAGASITATKQARLLRSAHHYLSGAVGTPACRFDVVLIDGDPLEGYWEWLKATVVVKEGRVVVDKR